MSRLSFLTPKYLSLVGIMEALMTMFGYLSVFGVLVSLMIEKVSFWVPLLIMSTPALFLLYLVYKHTAVTLSSSFAIL